MHTYGDVIPEDDIAGGENPYEDNAESGYTGENTEGTTEDTGEDTEGGTEDNTEESSTEESTENTE